MSSSTPAANKSLPPLKNSNFSHVERSEEKPRYLAADGNYFLSETRLLHFVRRRITTVEVTKGYNEVVRKMDYLGVV